ncbi:branched-chain amino acid aminotransferase [Anaerolinea thermolimosa]|nr:branched-chain amino acid aminotransferase [Anaerolinea thermolimosa]
MNIPNNAPNKKKWIRVFRTVPGGQLEDITHLFSDKTSLNDIQMSLPEGVYTTLRTYQKTKVIIFEQHIKRLVDSAQRLGKVVSVREGEIRNALRQIIQTQQYEGELRFRIYIDLADHSGQTFLFVEPLETPPAEAYTRGVKVKTESMKREHPEAKSTQFIAVAEALRKEWINGFNEIIMVDETGEMLEGLSSNFFAVQSGVVWTAGKGVLPGTTREIVLEVLHESGIPIHLQGFSCHHLRFLDEAFITSVSRGVLPVVEIDGLIIGNGRPGEMTRKIIQAFEQKIYSLAEEI